MNGKDTATTFEDVQRRCAIRQGVDAYPIEVWLKSAKTLYSRAQVAEENEELIDAYVFYSNTFDICFNCTWDDRERSRFGSLSV